MNGKLTMSFLAALVVLGVSGVGAQRTSGRDNGSNRETGRGSNRSGVSSSNGVINYQDTSKRNTQSTERDERKKKAEEEAKKKAEEEKRRAERDKRNGNDQQKATSMVSSTRAGNGNTSGSRNAQGGKPGSGPATKPVNAGGSTDPTTQDVTAVMLNAVRTQTVDFDPAKAKEEPGIMLLNAPKFDGTKRTRAGAGGGSIAQPL